MVDNRKVEAERKLLEAKREKLQRSLTSIHVFQKLTIIAYFESIKGTNFSNPKIKSKANQIEKFAEDILKSMGGVALKKEFEEYMEYEHFTELYELLKVLMFQPTESIRNLLDVFNQEILKQKSNA